MENNWVIIMRKKELNGENLVTLLDRDPVDSTRPTIRRAWNGCFLHLYGHNNEMLLDSA